MFLSWILVLLSFSLINLVNLVNSQYNTDLSYFYSMSISSTLDEAPSIPIYIREITLLEYNEQDERISPSEHEPQMTGFLNGGRMIDDDTETFAFPTGNSYSIAWNFTTNPRPIAGFYMLSTCDDAPSDFCTFDLTFSLVGQAGGVVERTIVADLYLLLLINYEATPNCSETELVIDSEFNVENTCSDEFECDACLDSIEISEDSVYPDLWHLQFVNTSGPIPDTCECLQLDGIVTPDTHNHLTLYYPQNSQTSKYNDVDEFGDSPEIGYLDASEDSHIVLRLLYWGYNGTIWETTCVPWYWVEKDIWFNISMYDTAKIEIEFKSDTLDISNTSESLEFRYAVQDYIISLFDELYFFNFRDGALITQIKNNTFEYDIWIDNIDSSSVAKKIEDYIEYESSTETYFYFEHNISNLLLSHFESIVSISDMTHDIKLYKGDDYDNNCAVYGLTTENDSLTVWEKNVWLLPTIIIVTVLCIALGCCVTYKLYKQTKRVTWRTTDQANEAPSVPEGLNNDTMIDPAAIVPSTQNKMYTNAKSSALLPSADPDGRPEGSVGSSGSSIPSKRGSTLISGKQLSNSSKFRAFNKSTKILEHNSNEDIVNNNNNNNGNMDTLAGIGRVGTTFDSNGYADVDISSIQDGNVQMTKNYTGIPQSQREYINKRDRFNSSEEALASQKSYNNNNNNNSINNNNSNKSGGNTYIKNEYFDDDEMENDGNLLGNQLENEMHELRKNRKAVEFDFERDLKVIKCIGIGSFGKVYKATWEDNPVAIKLFTNANSSTIVGHQSSGNNNAGTIGSISAASIGSSKFGHGSASGYKPSMDDMLNINAVDDETHKELFAEIVLASQIPYHPNVVKIIGFCKHPLCVVMDYMPGGSVRRLVYGELVNYRKTPGLTEKLTILVKAASGLEHLHKQHVIHRDIAARNILLGKFGIEGITQHTDVKVSDFGMARKMNIHGDETAHEQQTITQVGPLKWMSPESIRDHVYSEKTDVYMWGITMWEIMYGQEPYDDVDALNAAMKVVMQGERPHFLWPLPEELEELISDCWNKTPDKRPNFITIRKSLQKIQASEKKDEKDLKDEESSSSSE